MLCSLTALARPWLLVGLVGLMLPGVAAAQAGALDRSFGGDGKVTTDLGSGDESIQGVALQADGKIVAAGYTFGEPGDPGPGFVARYLTSGELDASFGVGGVASTGVIAFAVAVQTDGRIVVAGVSGGDFAIARFLPDGAPDPAFAGGGTRTVDFFGGHDAAAAVGLAGDAIVAGGTAERPDDLDFAVVRLTADGSLDPAFSDDGMQTVSFATNDRGRALAVRASGRIVIAGETDGARFETLDFALARLLPDGSLDPTFSGDGKLKTTIGAVDRAYDLAIQPNGRILAAGTGSFRGGSRDFVAVRYRPNGTLDRTFSGDGKQRTHVGTTADEAHGVVLQPNGKIVLAGNVGQNPRFALVRYRRNGALDRTFSGDGKQTTRIGALAYAWDVARQANGRLVAAGASNPGPGSGGYDLALARYRA